MKVAVPRNRPALLGSCTLAVLLQQVLHPRPEGRAWRRVNFFSSPRLVKGAKAQLGRHVAVAQVWVSICKMIDESSRSAYGFMGHIRAVARARSSGSIDSCAWCRCGGGSGRSGWGNSRGLRS